MSDHLTLAQAAQQTPGRPSASALWRWARKGVRARNGERVFLEHVRFGRQIRVTMKAVRRFGRNLAEADRAGLVRSDPEQELAGREPDNGAIADAESQLARAGA